MENKILQQNDYNALQLSLPIDLGIKIDEDDMVVSFLKALEGVNLFKYFKKGKCRGRKGYDRCKLLKVALFAYMLCDNDLRSMESLCRYDIRFMYIMGEETPSFMTFERLFKDYLVKNIDEIFFELSNNINNEISSFSHGMGQNWKQMQENIHSSIKQGSSMQEKNCGKK